MMLTPAELAAALEVEESTLAGWRRLGTGPEYTRLGQRVYYLESAVIEWLHQNIMKPKIKEDDTAGDKE
jgi:hypothetical protein